MLVAVTRGIGDVEPDSRIAVGRIRTVGYGYPKDPWSRSGWICPGLEVRVGHKTIWRRTLAKLHSYAL